MNLSMSILCEDVLENLRKATPCFMVGQRVESALSTSHRDGYQIEARRLPASSYPDMEMPTRWWRGSRSQFAIGFIPQPLLGCVQCAVCPFIQNIYVLGSQVSRHSGYA